MNSTLILFKEIGRQLLIVGLVLPRAPGAHLFRSVRAAVYLRNSCRRSGGRYLSRFRKYHIKPSRACTQDFGFDKRP